MNTDQAIRNFNLTGRVMKLSPLCPWSPLDLYFIVSVKSTFNLSAQTHYAEVVNIMTGKRLVVEIENGFALTLFSERN